MILCNPSPALALLFLGCLCLFAAWRSFVDARLTREQRLNALLDRLNVMIAASEARVQANSGLHAAATRAFGTQRGKRLLRLLHERDREAKRLDEAMYPLANEIEALHREIKSSATLRP